MCASSLPRCKLTARRGSKLTNVMPPEPEPGKPTPPNNTPTAAVNEPAKPGSGKAEAAPEPAPAPAPPPAAKVVLEGKRGEKDAALELELKKAQTRQSELEDENHRLKQVPKPDQAPKQKKGFLSGATFFDEED